MFVEGAKRFPAWKPPAAAAFVPWRRLNLIAQDAWEGAGWGYQEPVLPSLRSQQCASAVVQGNALHAPASTLRTQPIRQRHGGE